MTDLEHNPTEVSLNQLIDLNRAATGLKMHARKIRARQSGQYLSRIKGRGMEFDESRPYQPGDDVRNIDWRVTARTGSAHTKLFREERERPVFISLDARAPMFFATRGRFKSVIATELAALVAWAAHLHADRIGGEIFSAEQHTEFRPHRGQRHLLRFLKQLASLRPPGEPSNPDTLEAPFRRLHRIAHPGSLVCIISDFRGLDQAAMTQLSRVAKHNEVLLIHVFDELERELPKAGQYRVSYARRIITLDTSNQQFRRRYHDAFQQRWNILEQLAKSHHMNLLHCGTEQSPKTVMRDRFGTQPVSSRRTG
jgi:uncharacterized protein (DUF58 family)